MSLSGNVRKINVKKCVQENCFKLLCCLIFVVLLFLGLYYTYVSTVKPYAESEKKIISVQYNVGEQRIENGSTASQTFETKDVIEYFDINFVSKQKILGDSVIVGLFDKQSSELICKWELSSDEITDGMNRFYLEEGQDKGRSGVYTLTIEFKGTEYESSIGLYTSAINQYNKGELSIDGELTGKDISFAVYGGSNSFLYPMFILLAIFLVSGGVITCHMIFKAKLKLEKIFLLVSLVLGISHMFLMPAYSTPDERVHFATAYYYSNILMGEEPVDEDGNVLVRNEDLLLNVENIRPSLGTYGLIAENIFESCKDDTMVSYDVEPGNAPFWSYLPQILGISVARLLGLGNIMLLVLSDILALLSYIVCVYFAIKMIPFGKITMFVVGMLPMGLETAASFSYDVLVNAISLLFIGYVFKLAYEKKGAKVKDWVRLALLMFFLAPIKVVYVLLAFLCLLIPGQQSRKKWVGPVVVIGVGGLSCLILRMANIVTLATVSGAGSAGTAENTYTISYILSDPVHIVGVLYNTLCRMTDAILQPLFGQRLGYWDISIPHYIAFGFVLALLLSVIIREQEKLYIKSWQKVLMFFICVGIIGGITLSMMLDFTDVTDTVVRGIQGRYFIPFLPLALFLFRNDRIVTRIRLDGQLIMAVFMLNYFTLWRIFEDVVAR